MNVILNKANIINKKKFKITLTSNFIHKFVTIKLNKLEKIKETDKIIIFFLNHQILLFHHNF